MSSNASSLPPPTPDEWDRLVVSHPRATLYQTWRWSEFAGRVFGFDVHRIINRDQTGQLVGVLPLVMQTSSVFGRRLVSLPYFNYGGPLGQSSAVEKDLLLQAAELARSERAKLLEIRDQAPREGFAIRTDKVMVELDLPGSEEELAAKLGTKLRSQVRRADREEPAVSIGGDELVGAFYGIFSATMRDLGTPVYPRHFFNEMFASLAADCSVVLVRLHGKPGAAAVLTRFRDRTEVVWAASLRELRPTAVNMRLYWECLRHAVERGSRIFDFGRSTMNSGTHRFKLQWGGQTRPLYWVYPLGEPGHAPSPSDGRLTAYARRAWTRLPLPVANQIGPWISPGLPW